VFGLKNAFMFFKLYAIALPVFFALDMIWLAWLARGFYQNQIGFLMKPQVNWSAAIIFYLLFLVGLVVFVIEPALAKRDWLQAVGKGALFGLITYATFDLTNLATLKDWPFTVVWVDMLWGTVLAASVSVITYALAVRWIA
jgi:uncharacterized membrane protein